MVYLIGASGHAKVILEILEILGVEIGALVDQNPEVTNLLNYVVGQDFPKSYHNLQDHVIVSIGNNLIRKRIVNSNIYNYYLAIHPKTNISSRAIIGIGTVVMAGATINTGVKICTHCIINTNASIDHDCFIADFVHISPNVALAGDVTIGEGTHVGIGACILQGLTVGKWAIIGAGAVIINNIPDYAVVVGNPGKIIKYKYHDAE